MADAGAALARVVEIHDVAPAAEGADRQAAADDLPERREIGPDPEPLLGAAPRGPERDHLVEDQYNIMSLGDLAQTRQEPVDRRYQAGITHHRIHDQAGQLRGFFFQDLRARVRVVPRQHHHVLEHRRRDPGRPGDRLGPLAAAGTLAVAAADAHHHPVVRAVIGALELRDLRPARDRARQPHRVHRGFGARVRETDGLDGGHPARQRLGQAHLVLGRPGERQPVLGRLLHGLHDVRRRMAQDEARVVAVEVEAVDPVGVPDVRALAALDRERIRIEEGRGAAVAARHDRQRLFVQHARAAGLRGVLAQLLVDAHAISSLTAVSRSASASRSSRCASATVTARKRNVCPGRR